MVDPRASRFWQAALRSGLMKAAALEACLAEIAPEKRTAEAIDRRLARQAVNAGYLTIWQAQQVLSGRTLGLKIDRYELRDAIGQGGMGRVYLARDTRLNRPVALKILSRERSTNPRALARFGREARVGAQLQHANLVRIYDEGEAQGLPYLVMEYIEGPTVSALLTQHNRLPPALAAEFGRQVALGLEHLHEKGLLHRDINPSNILIDKAGTAKLTDLGLAIDLEDTADVVTRDGATVGTFDYISPEQARHPRSVDIRSDLYSLGCSLYHMLGGRVPFPAASLPEKLMAHQSSEPEPLTALAPGCPPGLEAVVRRLMRKSPGERYERPADLARVLEPFASGPVPLDRIAAIAAGAPGPQPPEELPTEATPGSNPGSDPELAVRRAESQSVSLSGTDQHDVFAGLNLGSPTSLADDRTSSRTRSTDAPRRLPVRPVLKALLQLTLLAAVASGAWWAGTLALRAWSSGPGGSTQGGGESGEGTRPVEPPRQPEIAVRYNDGEEVAVSSLHEAISLATGKRAEVVLRNAKPLDERPTLPLEVSSDLTIRAGPGAHPLVRVILAGAEPWLRVKQGQLTLEGLSLQVEATAPRAEGKPPALIESGGALTLDRCRLVASGDRRDMRAARSSGLLIHLAGCEFDGFDTPVEIEAFPKVDIRLTHCLFVRTGMSRPAEGWALEVEGGTVAQSRPRKLSLDHCTVVGGGLLRAQGFTPEDPLEVTAESNLVRAGSLLMWGGPFPNALRWSGRSNHYLISGAAWAVRPPDGSEALPDAPTDLTSWTRGPIAEVDPRASNLPFASPSAAEGSPPADFAASGGAQVGIDPKQVGPK